MLVKRIILTVITVLFLSFSYLNAQKAEIRVFEDKDFTAMPEYNATDVLKLFEQGKRVASRIDAKQLEKISYPETKLLILPYLKGNFSEKALQAMIRFHSEGGGLFFIGDLPNKDKWYPLRNMQSSDFYLTRGGGSVNVEGLTAKGREILKSLPDKEYFQGHPMPSVSVTAFPPDKTYNLIQNNSDAWALSPVMAVERKCEKFLGARLCVYGFNGGEPRENVDGAYQRKWTWDPGMLTRDWKGCDTLIRNMAEWIRQTPDIAGAIGLTRVHKPDGEDKIYLRIRNLSGRSVSINDIILTESGSGRELFHLDRKVIPAHEIILITELASPGSFGTYHYLLTASIGGTTKALDSTVEYVLPPDAASFPGFGYSTYWSFREPKVSEPFKYFTVQMKKLGLQYLRANIPWEDVEPEPGIYDWRIPADMLKFAGEENIPIAFWMFATTQGSGLGDGGVPWWTLKEPAIDREGNKGFHPTLWSPFYRDHYFGMIDTFTRRFSDSKMLTKFILDFGNSDFPYGYYYYVNPPDLFDYSEYEKAAFSRYLRNHQDYSLGEVSRLYGMEFPSWDKVPVPFAENEAPWRVYLNFRRWSIEQGMKIVHEICAKNAPAKVPEDLPGHGLGSIADLASSWYDVKARHWYEEKKFDPKYTELHNSGPKWGGEPWQVGGGFKEFDDALFGSLRYNANYFSIPGPDLAVDPDGIAKAGFIRRTIMGAAQTPARIAMLDMVNWNNFQSACQVGARMDQRVDLLGFAHRFDFSCYDLMVLPDDELVSSVGTVNTAGSLLPEDENWYWLLRESVEKGLTIVVFPNTCVEGRSNLPGPFLRKVMGIEDVEYGERKSREVEFPGNFGGGSAKGEAVSVSGDGEVLLRDRNNNPVLVKRKLGKGAILLAGWDNHEDSFDGKLNYFKQERIGTHMLVRLAQALGLSPLEISSGQLNIYKALVRREDKEYLLLYSHLDHEVVQEFKVKLNTPAREGYDLASDEIIPVRALGGGWYSITLTVLPRTGRYISFHDR